jgi:hypothetical protein
MFKALRGEAWHTKQTPDIKISQDTRAIAATTKTIRTLGTLHTLEAIVLRVSIGDSPYSCALHI